MTTTPANTTPAPQTTPVSTMDLADVAYADYMLADTNDMVMVPAASEGDLPELDAGMRHLAGGLDLGDLTRKSFRDLARKAWTRVLDQRAAAVVTKVEHIDAVMYDNRCAHCNAPYRGVELTTATCPTCGKVCRRVRTADDLGPVVAWYRADELTGRQNPANPRTRNTITETNATTEQENTVTTTTQPANTQTTPVQPNWEALYRAVCRLHGTTPETADVWERLYLGVCRLHKMDPDSYQAAIQADALTPAKPADAPQAPAKPATPAAPAKAAQTTQVVPAGLTANATKVLTVLAAAKTPLNRKELAEKTGINKGWSRLLGAATKDDGGAAGDTGLEARGLVSSTTSGKALAYTITPAGRKALGQ